MSEIDLQCGFDGEPVTLTVDDREVFRADQVTTRLLTGIAEHIELPDAVGPVRVQVRLGGPSISKVIEVKQQGCFYLGISLENEEIKYQVADEPFGYA